MCVGSQLMLEGVCLFFMTWKFDIKPEINSESGCNGTNLFTQAELKQTGWVRFVKNIFFTSTCHNILISRANYMFSCSTYGSTTQSMRSNDAVANLHCVNTKWVIWKRCWHVDPVIKPNAFTYSVNAPVQCNVHPYIHSLFQKAKRETQAI